MYLCNPLKLDDKQKLFSVHDGNFVAVDVLDPGSDTVVVSQRHYCFWRVTIHVAKGN